jgi:aspartate/methionine/tyrosine aminotransferase
MFPSQEYLHELMEFAAKHNLWVVSDEVYQDLYFSGKPVSVSSFTEEKDRIILVNSLSKTYAMTGWRIGYLAAPEQVISNALKAGQNSITCVAPFIQKGAAFALTDPGVQKIVDDMRCAYERRREKVIQVARNFGQSPIVVIPPQGTFYFFLDFRGIHLPSSDICNQILDQTGVGLVPGSAFGAGGEGFIRMSITASDEKVEKGFFEILSWANQQVGE